MVVDLFYICKGIEDGMRIRLAGEGNAPQATISARKTKNGDLYVRIRVMPHAIFRRKGSDIFHTVTIPMTTAALGGTIKVPTLDNDVELKVPSGTATGDVIVMNGKGIERLHSNGMKGDIKYDFKVTIPKYNMFFRIYFLMILEYYLLMNEHCLNNLLHQWVIILQKRITRSKEVLYVFMSIKFFRADQKTESDKKSQEGFFKRTFRKLQYSNDS